LEERNSKVNVICIFIECLSMMSSHLSAMDIEIYSATMDANLPSHVLFST